MPLRYCHTDTWKKSRDFVRVFLEERVIVLSALPAQTGSYYRDPVTISFLISLIFSLSAIPQVRDGSISDRWPVHCLTSPPLRFLARRPRRVVRHVKVSTRIIHATRSLHPVIVNSPEIRKFPLPLCVNVPFRKLCDLQIIFSMILFVHDVYTDRNY